MNPYWAPLGQASAANCTRVQIVLMWPWSRKADLRQANDKPFDVRIAFARRVGGG